MATYLTLNSKFTPYTYEEILKPYQDRQKALEDKLTALEETSAKASLWEGILDPVADKEYYESFNEFKSRLEDLSGRLSAGDASAVTKKELSKLKQEYNKQFVPLELKYAELKQAQEEQRKYALQAAVSGKNIRFTKDMQGVSLSSALTDPTWNQYGTIQLDDISEKAIAAGTAYGKNAAFYNVFGTTRGNTTPEDINAALEKLYSQYIPSGVSTSLSDEIKKVISSSFLLGSQQSYAKDISDILSTDMARSIQATQANTTATRAAIEKYELDAALAAKGLKIQDGKLVKLEENNTDPKDKSFNPNDLLYDNIYTNLHYLEDTEENRKYYKKDSKEQYSEVPIDGSKVAFKQNGKIKYYDYKEDKIYIKDQDGNYVEDIVRTRSEDYDKNNRPKLRTDFNTLYKNIKYISNNKLQSFNTGIDVLKTLEEVEEDRIEIIPADEFKRNSDIRTFGPNKNIAYNIPEKVYNRIVDEINITGYDPEQLVLIRDKENPKDFFIVLKNEPGLPVSYLSNYPKLYMKANGIEAVEEKLTPTSKKMAPKV